MFNATFSGGSSFTATFGGPENFGAEMTETITKMVAEYFEGPYEYTPGEEEQTIPIAELVATQNIKVNPVPQNYGRLTYSGGILKVW